MKIRSTDIEDHALLGDLETAALVGRDGSVDWLCLPRFDSPAAFAALHGGPGRGFWRLAPRDADECAYRAYRADTLVLDTVWETPDGAVRITDFMPPRATRPCLVRRVEGMRGAVPVRGVLRLRFHHGRIVPWLRQVGPCTVAVAGPDAVWARIDGPGSETLDPATGTSTVDVTVTAGQSCAVTLVWAPSHLTEPPAELAVPAQTLLKETVEFWRRWAARCTYEGPWRPAVIRSLLTWKALTHAPTGAVLSAPTAWIPYGPGGEPGGDGRVCRLDGLGQGLATLLRCGLRAEATAWVEWLLRTVAGDPAALRSTYGIAGERGLLGPEPPRLDAYGEVLDALHLALRARLPVVRLGSGRLAAELTRAVEGAWREEGPGVSVRADVLAWAALDRGERIARLLGGPGATEPGLRAALRHRVESGEAHGLPDPAHLLLPRLGLLPATHPRVRAALDGLPRQPAPRVADALLRARVLAGAGREAEAAAVFARVLDARDDVGLLAERWDPRTGDRLGDAPATASHLALVDTALALTPRVRPAQHATADRSTIPESP
ncbi:trehalase-like domain-containing protein [Streptomyces sp. NPDC052225]|uniref:glycoside hydrolase family 15 protein n=1 Tax=Streptomyces sp. NPDC052225 TaxID=3154949 RepID=UPI00342297C5